MRIIDQLLMRSDEPGTEKVLEWLKSFEQTVVDSDAVGVLTSLVQLGVERPDSCDCNKGKLFGEPVPPWEHAHHAEYNRAVWEIISQKPGLIDNLRTTIQADINGPQQRLDGMLYGQITARTYARELLASFIKHKPSTRWIGT